MMQRESPILLVFFKIMLTHFTDHNNKRTTYDDPRKKKTDKLPQTFNSTSTTQEALTAPNAADVLEKEKKALDVSPTDEEKTLPRRATVSGI